VRQTERLQKYLARAGVASRRAAEKLIESGRVKVNGQTVVKMGVKVNPHKDKVMVDNRPISIPRKPFIYIMLNKPPQVLSSTSDDRGRKTVLDYVDVAERVFPIGRLDYHSEGLILLTNDGQLTQKLTHPAFAHEREYQVLVQGAPTRDVLRRWRAGGFEVDGKPVGPMQVERLPAFGDGWLRVILTEGRKRQIREVAKQLNHPVITLLRVRFGPIELGNLKTGAWRYLTQREIAALKGSAHLVNDKSPTGKSLSNKHPKKTRG
jgi:23S rRNA pseudouridine2605 synthase